MSKLVSFVLAACLLGTAAAQAAQVTVIHRFSAAEGTTPQTALAVAPDGRLFGTTLVGGAFGRGTIFAVDPATGDFETVHDFAADEGSDPYGQLLLASHGNFYGTTRYGGDPNCASGCGTIYRVSPSGQFATLHAMTFLEGTTLQGGLIEGGDGVLYGTATLGGLVNCIDQVGGCGTVYAFAPQTSTVTVLHRFDTPDGRFPYGRLVLASDGLLYGTTSSGASGEAGTVYRLSTRGKKFRTLVEFAHTAATAGCQPQSGLIQAGDGRFYGATPDCGSFGAGAIYSVTAKGKLRTVYRFDPDGTARTGKDSTAELLLGPNGDLFGTTRLGGKPIHADEREGIVFRLDLSGKLSVLHTFKESPDGSQPSSGLVTGLDGNLYGVTPIGGAEPFPGYGAVYRLTIGN